MSAKPATEQPKPLRALIVEGSESDALLLADELRRIGYALEHQRVETAEAMKAALDRTEWDVVLSSYHLQGFGGPEALQLLHQHGRDIPFILVTGSIGENAAVQMMKAGAHDFILKGSLARLEPVLRRELADAAARRSVATQKQRREELERALRDTREHHIAERAALERHYRTLIQNAYDIVLLFDDTGAIVEANLAAVAAYGYEPGELLTMNLRDLVQGDPAEALGGDVAATAIRRGLRFEGLHRRKDGSTFPVEVSSKPIPVNGSVFWQSFVRDISERKRLDTERQAAEEKFRALVEQSMVGVYMLDATSVRYANPRTEQMFGYAPGEMTGRSFLEFVAAEYRTDVRREFARMFAGQAATVRVDFGGLRKDGKTVMIGAVGTLAHLAGEAVAVGALQDITEKFQAERKAQDYVERLEQAMFGTVDAISRIMDLRDPYTSGHEQRVGEISAAIAAEMGLDVNLQKGLRVAGAVHDVGKITVPAEILSKPGKLSAMEFQIIKAHAAQGFEVLKDIAFAWPVAKIALQHHERWDGSGYPAGLKGEEIIPEARILAVADVVEAMASHRPYRPGLGMDAALAEIARGKGTSYETRVAEACLRLFREKGYSIPA